MDSNILLYPLFLPIVAGAFLLLLPRSRRFLPGAILSTVVTGAVLAVSILIFTTARTDFILFKRSWLGVAGIDFHLLAKSLIPLFLWPVQRLDS